MKVTFRFLVFLFAFLVTAKPATADHVLVLVDQTMQGRIDRDLQDWQVAAFADGFTSEVLWCPRAEVGTAAWKQGVLDVAAQVRDVEFDYLLIVGGVVAPYSGSKFSDYLNAGHYTGAALADTVYAAPQIPLASWTSRDVRTVAPAGGQSSYNDNRPNDGTFDVDGYSIGTWESWTDKTECSFNDRTLRPKPFGRVDATRLGVYGVPEEWTDEATDEEVALIAEYLQRCVRWRFGRQVPLPAEVTWDNSQKDLTTWQAADLKLRGSMSPYGTAVDRWVVGDNSGGATGWQQFVPVPAAATLAISGGGPSGDGPYLNYGPWNNDPSRRTLSSSRFETVQHQTYVWYIYGSYVQDVGTPRSLVRVALFQPGSECVAVNPWFGIGVEPTLGPKPGQTFGQVYAEYLNWFGTNWSMQFHPLEVHNRGAGDPTLQSVPLATPYATADYNADGFVDFDDLLILSANYNLPGSLSTGDSTLDGVVDFDDLMILAAQYNMPAP